MNDNESASTMYCLIFHMDTDNGDAYAHGILSAIKTLDEREQRALEYYYRHKKTFEQIGQLLGGIKREAARQVVYKALQKLRHPSKTRNMSVSAIVKYHKSQLDNANATITELYNVIDRFAQGIQNDKEIPAVEVSNRMSIIEIGFSSRVSNHLLEAGINTVEALLSLSSLGRLLEKRNFGKKSFDEIIMIMRERGYCEWADRMVQN